MVALLQILSQEGFTQEAQNVFGIIFFFLEHGSHERFELLYIYGFLENRASFPRQVFWWRRQGLSLHRVEAVVVLSLFWNTDHFKKGGLKLMFCVEVCRGLLYFIVAKSSWFFLALGS